MNDLRSNLLVALFKKKKKTNYHVTFNRKVDQRIFANTYKSFISIDTINTIINF